MSRPFFRITTRWMMFAIVIIAILTRGVLWIGEMRYRSEIAGLAASVEELDLWDYQLFRDDLIKEAVNSSETSQLEAVKAFQERIDEATEKIRVYRWVAAHPWLPLPPELVGLSQADFSFGPVHCGYMSNVRNP